MIEGIKLADEGAYDSVGCSLHNLKALNFVYGPNGSGKTTISRVIEGLGSYPSCNVDWRSGRKLEALVYNRDFVHQHFEQTTIKGVYTFGENVEAAGKIAGLKGEEAVIVGKLNGLKATLTGDDGKSGHKQGLEDLQQQFTDDLWSAKKSVAGLEAAFTGVNNSKKNFCARYLEEAKSNSASVKETVDLIRDAGIVYSSTLREATMLQLRDRHNLQELETAGVLSKVIIGQQDVDIAALIEKLGNSDWVQQGRSYFHKLTDQCPFCQQTTTEKFRESLERFFDQSYMDDLSKVELLLDDYITKSSSELADFNEILAVESDHLDREALKRDVAALQIVIDSNVSDIRRKRKEPSSSVSLASSTALVDAIRSEVLKANAAIQKNNDTIRDIASRRKELTAQIWRRLLENTKTAYSKYDTSAKSLERAIDSLEKRSPKRLRTFAPSSRKSMSLSSPSQALSPQLKK